MDLQSIIFLVFPISVAIAAVFDLFTMTIPNRISAFLAAGFLVAAFAIGMPFDTLALSLFASLAVLVVGFGLFAAGWIGGGDAKLAAAVTLWLGVGQLLPFVLYTAVFGGLLTIGLLVFRSRMVPAFALRQDWVMRLHDPKVGVPYGIALAASALLCFPETPFLRLALG